MRRADREVTELEQMKEILNGSKIGHLSMVDEGMPYVVPLSYSYKFKGEKLEVYFHCAKEGRKLDILQRNPLVCFEVCQEGEPIYAAKTPCNSGYYYSSFIAFGKVEFVENVSEKQQILSHFMRHQAALETAFTEAQANSVCIFKVVSTDYTAKRKERPAM